MTASLSAFNDKTNAKAHSNVWILSSIALKTFPIFVDYETMRHEIFVVPRWSVRKWVGGLHKWFHFERRRILRRWSVIGLSIAKYKIAEGRRTGALIHRDEGDYKTNLWRIFVHDKVITMKIVSFKYWQWLPTTMIESYWRIIKYSQLRNKGCLKVVRLWYDIKGEEEGGRASVARPDVQDQFTHDPICVWMMVVGLMMMSKTNSSIP